MCPTFHYASTEVVPEQEVIWLGTAGATQPLKPEHDGDASWLNKGTAEIEQGGS